MIGVGDLRLGDIVQTKIMGENKLGTVSGIAIGTSRIFLQISDICNFVDTLLTEIEGVLLTTEILEKNRWFSSAKLPFCYTHNDHRLEVVIDPNSEWKYAIKGNETLRKVKYVHELQHILWALGLNTEIKV